MKPQISNDLNNCGPPTPIFYKPNQKIGKTSISNSDPPKVDINTQTGEKDIDTVDICVLMFCTGSVESLLSFVTILSNIIKGQELSTGP